MTGRDPEQPGLLTRGYWIMMALAALSFIAAAATVTLGPRLLGARTHAAPLAGEARGAKDGHARSPLGPP